VSARDPAAALVPAALPHGHAAAAALPEPALPRRRVVPTGSRAWLRLCALLGALALLGFMLPTALLDGQPGRWLGQPWRLWTAAWVHWTPLHLAANVAGLMVVALYGCAAEVRSRDALAWLLAWPLTHLALAWWAAPAPAHYGGLSGVLHAGVAVASTALLARRGWPRAVGAAVGAALLLKLGTESRWWPWADGPGALVLDVAVAPQAHAAGVAAGLLCALVVGIAAANRPH
jgi:rhomboid family GlyGly-CTERM serine protease